MGASGHRHTLQLLLDRGADLDAEMMSGFTPLHVAALADQVGRLLLLIVCIDALFDFQFFHLPSYLLVTLFAPIRPARAVI